MLIIFLFILGSIVGSFYNVCIYRLPNDIDIISKKSACTSCQYKIPFYQNIPIITYIFNFGKCRNCKSKISVSYLIVELFTAILFVYAYQKFGLTIKNLAFITFYSALITIFFTDFKYYLILDKITYPIIIIGFGFVLLDESPFEIEMFDSLLGGAIGFFTIYLIRYIFFKIRKIEGMGMGDAKLFLLVGIWLGIKSIYIVLASSAIVGALVGSLIIYFYKKDKNFQIPYGCFIVIAAGLYPYLGSLFYNLI